MAAETTYSEAQLAAYLVAQLGELATALGWAQYSLPVVEAVNEAMLAYPVAACEQATDVRKLRALARLELWRAVASATAGHYRFATAGQTFDREQVHDHALANLKLAESEALEFSPSYHIPFDKAFRPHDPYNSVRDELRPL